jgi:chromate transporter
MKELAANEVIGDPSAANYTLWQLVRYMLGLGTWGFGGPVALVGYMYRDLVEKRHWISDWHKLGQIAAYFAYAGSFVFGSGLAIVPFLYGGVVKEYGWLTDRQFVDAVAVAMITPGPVVITTGFIGFLVAGFWGAVVAAVGTFLPCYLLTILPAPYFKKHGKRPAIVAFVDGVTAAAIGAITGAVIVIGQRSITDWITAALALITVAILWRFKKIPEPAIVLAAALIGLLVHPLIAHT